MRREIAIGEQDFETLRVRNSFYVDKTDFIREWWNGRDSVTLITRPRRFGKTLNMSMLNCFFSNHYANRGELFEGLKIWKDPAFRQMQGTYPVLYLSFAGIKQTTIQTTRRSINRLIRNLYKQYKWLLQESELFTEEDAEFYREVGPDMPDDVAADSINNLCEWLYRYYGKKVLIFLDEYDTPLQEAYIHGFWDELVSYTRALFNSTFKTNPSLERAIMTGITRVSRESIFSDLNNLEVVTTTSGKYATAFGFLEEEVFRALEEQEFPEAAKAEVKQWYDGFTFGEVKDIYNPWSITNYLDKRTIGTYWANSSSNGLIGELLRTGQPDIKSRFETLMEGGEVDVPVDEQIVYNRLDTNPAAIWSLLLASGYLKVLRAQTLLEASEELEPRTYTLALTNREVLQMFGEMIREWFQDGSELTRFVKATLQGDAESMEIYLNNIMLASMSSFDGGSNPSIRLPENFYHGLVLGLLVDQAGQYNLRSNRESGYGRYDVVMEPKKPDDPAVILEFKVLDARKGEKTLEDTAENALKQISEKKYDAELLSRGIPAERILRYGLAFKGKECLIRKA